jgi:hypothetical protein
MNPLTLTLCKVAAGERCSPERLQELADTCERYPRLWGTELGRWLRRLGYRSHRVVSHTSVLVRPHPLACDHKARKPTPPNFAEEIALLIGREGEDVLRALGFLPVLNEATALQMLEDLSADWSDEIAEVVRGYVVDELEAAGTREIVRVVEQRPSAVPVFDVGDEHVQRFVADETRAIGNSATDAYRDDIRTQIIGGMDANETVEQIAARIENVVGDEAVAKRALTIARTETAFAQVFGAIEGWRQSGVVQGKQFLLSSDPCPFCLEVADRWGSGYAGDERNTPIPLTDPIWEFGGEITASFTLKDGSVSQRSMSMNYEGYETFGGPIGPPIHPNCRCDMIPILDDA